jgi:hypothetical protein
MKFSTNLKSGRAIHALQMDLADVAMTDEQRAIATKLFDKAKDQTIDLDGNDSCEDGKCLASSLLSGDEFAKIRGLKAQLGEQISGEWIIIDFCIHPVRHKD